MRMETGLLLRVADPDTAAAPQNDPSSSEELCTGAASSVGHHLCCQQSRRNLILAEPLAECCGTRLRVPRWQYLNSSQRHASSVNCQTVGMRCPNSGLPTTSAWRLMSICYIYWTMPLLKAVVHCLAADQHHNRWVLIRASDAGFSGVAQIYLPQDHGDDHNDGTSDEGLGHKLKVSFHGNRTASRSGLVARLHEDAARRCYAVGGLTEPLFCRHEAAPRVV